MYREGSIIEDAEAQYRQGNDIGILILHGFMGTPQSVQFLSDKFASFGYTVLTPRIAGHGTNPYDLERFTYQDWFDSAEAGYQKLKENCHHIFVIGQSMGGALALWLANKHNNIDGMMLINPALRIPAYERLRNQTKPRFLEEGAPDIKANNVHEITYSSVPLHAIHELQKLMDQTPSILHTISTPVLGMVSVEDHLVPAVCTDRILAGIQSNKKEKLHLNNSYHVASMDNDKAKIVRASHQFVQQQLKHKMVSK